MCNFISYASYYRHFIEIFSKISIPVCQLLPKDVEFVWTSECEATFVKIKELVCKASILCGLDWKLSFHISTDASHIVVGVVLGKKEDKKPYEIYYVNENLTRAELNYTVTKK